MENIGNKVEDGGSTAQGRYSPSEYNNHKNELQNPVTRSGQSFNAGSEDQMSKALAIHGFGSGTFIDSGTANTVEVTPVTGSAGILIPTDYAQFEGARVSFYVNAANTGATTLNIGQTNGTLLGTKKLWRNGNTELLSGDLVPGRLIEAIFDTSLDTAAGAWVMTDWSSTQTSGTGAMMHVLQQVPSGTPGGTSIVGYQKRALNTVAFNAIEGAVLGVDEVTLPAGTYYIEYSAPAVDPSLTQVELRVGLAVISSGDSMSHPTTGSEMVRVIGRDVVVLASPSSIELWHYITNATVSGGLGVAVPATAPNPEKYANVIIWRL
jgi:hypothetical protein